MSSHCQNNHLLYHTNQLHSVRNLMRSQSALLQEAFPARRSSRNVTGTSRDLQEDLKYFHKLKRNSAPAADGITAEHLIYCVNSDIIRYITNMLTLCVQFGVVLDNFTNGFLIPIPKKAGCDTSIPKNWRPIVISTTLSKILEMYVLEESNTHEFNDLQFGFIPGRGTEIAKALTWTILVLSY